MSNLIEMLFALEERRAGDAIILQTKSEGGNGAPRFHSANAIIQRLNTPGGYQWCLRLLMPSVRGPIAGSGIYGDLNHIVHHAERQFGVKSEVREWVSVEYTNPDFPFNLLPM